MRTSLLASSIAALALAGCDSGEQRPGLILAKSIFAESGEPTPATLVLMRAPSGWGTEGNQAEEWEQETIMAEPGAVELQLGEYEGEVVFRRVEAGGDGGKVPTGPVVDLQARGDRWAMSDRTDITPDDVQWDTRSSGAPATKLYEIAGGNVFHKAMWWDPAYGEPGILTITANMPYLQVWRDQLGSWEPETLWTAEVGGKEQRFRDVEVGDVDGDGADELVVVTHDLGAVFVLEQTPDGLEPTELHRHEERTFVHEVEICDVDGDGVLDFFTTPSEPNKLGDGDHDQAGAIDMYRFVDGAYQRTQIAHYDHQHAKEILGYDYDRDGKAEIYGALEGEQLEIQVYRWDEASGGMKAEESIPLDDQMCRFLSGGDTNGDGVVEIVASTKAKGIYSLSHDGKGWVADKIVAPFASSGFEHATLLLDWDLDGVDELFVASDDQNRVQRIYFDGENGKGRYRRERLVNLDGQTFFTWNVMELPPGK